MLQLTSSAFADSQSIPSTYSCQGKAVNPPLSFIDVPESAQSLVLIVEDPDAPNGTFIHWVVFNISPLVKEIAENTVPTGSVQGVSGTGAAGFVAPCPPSGTHRYIFDLFALDTLLSLTDGCSKADVEEAMKGHVIEKTQLVGLYAKTM